jgi:outer membrane protein assembly factor BamA
VTTGLNIIEGTRGKITFKHYQGLNNADNSFGQLSADLRHYQRIYKEIVFAVRGFGGTFFGRSPKEYLLGGMDNWVLNRTRYGGTTGSGEENPLRVLQGNQDILFVEYVTSLRGFDYATLFGNKVLLMNAELRVPLIRALTSAPISSSFFRNMQLIAFYDIGTSWSGKPPFKGGASASIDRINNNPFIIDIKRFINPWLYSYGVGMRTVMLGYYMKVDLAWPVENFEVQSPRWFITLGFDF